MQGILTNKTKIKPEIFGLNSRETGFKFFNSKDLILLTIPSLISSEVPAAETAPNKYRWDDWSFLKPRACWLLNC